MNEAALSPPTAVGETIRFEYVPKPGLWRIAIVNFLLGIVTLTIYRFWGKTRARQHIWSCVHVNGQPLEYTGTGKELFLGFLVVFFAFVLPLMLGGVAIALLFPGDRSAIAIYQLAAYALFFLLLGNAIYRAQRYRLSRTRWRGIHAGLAGSPARYGWTYLWTLAAPFALVAALAGATIAAGQPSIAGLVGTLGFIAALWVFPWRSNKLQRLMTADMRFGDRPLSYTGTSGPLYKRYFFAWAGSALLYIAAGAATAYYAYSTGMITMLQEKVPPRAEQAAIIALLWLGVMIAIGLITAWYRANQMNHFAAHTHLDGATFNLNASGKGLMWLLFSNWMLSVLGLLGGLALGGAAAYAAGVLPDAPVPGAAPAEPGLLPILLIAMPIVVATTLATTFAQFRSARYFLSRLKLDGPVDLALIQQGANTGPKRGEGLAQVFDLDAF